MYDLYILNVSPPRISGFSSATLLQRNFNSVQW